jgi:hypothetical protein
MLPLERCSKVEPFARRILQKRRLNARQSAPQNQVGMAPY